MTTDDEFTTRLIEFGLNEKEAQTYLYLLKYGPKTPSPLAKSLHTYREDVHRTLTSLIDKGMVRPSLDSPTNYAAVDLNSALDSAVKKQESELRELEGRKRELQEFAKRQQFGPVEEISTFKLIKNLKEATTLSLASAASIKEELVFVFPTRALLIGSLAGVTEAFIKLVARGVRVRGIADISCTDISCAGIELVQELLDGGVDVRYLDQYHGIYFAVSDRKTCLSVISGEPRRVSLSEPTTMLSADDRTYAASLSSNFELLWEQAAPASQRIKELLEERPHTLGG
jgi:sugar-specific transcriptional regulator TrmB